MFALKPISHDSVAGALAKAERYRLLNEPSEAESICRDILEIEPDNQQALINLILALTDQIPQDTRAFANALDTVSHLALALRPRLLRRHRVGAPGQGALPDAAVTARTATSTNGSSRPCSYSKKPSRSAAPGNDDAVLRWNACVRFLNHHRELAPAYDDVAEPIVSE